MKCQSYTLQYQPQQHIHSSKRHASHTTLTATDSEMEDNNKKPVLILAITTPASDWLKVTLAVILTRIYLQGTWIRRPRWNWCETRNIYGVATKDTTTRIAENDRLNKPWSPQLKPCQSEENQGQKDSTRIKSSNDCSLQQLRLNPPISARF